MTNNGVILIVDDDPGTQDTIRDLLLQENYDLASAANGHDALARIDDIKPDVILLDVMMPGMNGFEVCLRLKSDIKWRHIPIILVTMLDSKEDIVRGLEAGADEFLSKPVSGIELRARVRSMLRIKRQFDELEGSLQMREDLSHMVVHDMNSPLTVITGYAEILKTKLTKPDELSNIEVILAEAGRLSLLINDILTIAKMEAGRLIPNRSVIDINQLVLGIVQGQDMAAQLRGVNLTKELPKKAPQVSVDANLFRRVLDNLILNAIKFSPLGSTVTVRVESPEKETGKYLRIKILDEGPGIPEENRGIIFDKFQTVELERKGVSQTGLGLAFCKMVVETHEGRIFVDANEPVGSVFTVEV